MICFSSSVGFFWLSALAGAFSNPQDANPSLDRPAAISQPRQLGRSILRRAPGQLPVTTVSSRTEPECEIFVERPEAMRTAITLQLESLDRRVHRSTGFVPTHDPTRLPRAGDPSQRMSLKTKYMSEAIALAERQALANPLDAHGRVLDKKEWCGKEIQKIIRKWATEGWLETRKEALQREDASRREREEMKRKAEIRAEEERKARSLGGRLKKWGKKLRTGEERVRDPGYRERR